jgi:hypothetical protein
VWLVLSWATANKKQIDFSLVSIVIACDAAKPSVEGTCVPHNYTASFVGFEMFIGTGTSDQEERKLHTVEERLYSAATVTLVGYEGSGPPKGLYHFTMNKKPKPGFGVV